MGLGMEGILYHCVKLLPCCINCFIGTAITSSIESVRVR
jgi:hypothetical protein